MNHTLQIANNRQMARRAGSTLISVMIVALMASMASIGLVELSQYHHRSQYFREDRMVAYYTAENLFLEGVRMIGDGSGSSFKGSYTTIGSDAGLTMPYTLPSEVTSTSLTIADDPLGQTDNYLVTASATINGRTRRIQGLVRKDPPSQVFDYEYFLNNWGWWWGNTIYGNGGQRSNWDFDFRYNPTVNGEIFASGNVEEDQTPVDPFGSDAPFTGLAHSDPLTYVHSGAPQLQMPNLLDFNYYASQADGSITVGGTTKIDKVYGTVAGGKGLYLAGTDASPIQINGSVVVPGDLIIKGKITGQGTIYVGGNLYIADNLQYTNGPDYSGNPGAMSDADQKTWVDNALTNNKDMVAFATRGSILGGKVNSTDWKSQCYDNGTYGMKVLGDESKLGADGIRNTPDDNIPYVNAAGETTTAYDADGNGVIRTSNYSYTNDVQMNSTRIANIDDYPKDTSGNAVSYDSISSSGITKLQGLFYTNHALAIRTGSGPDEIDGSVICRDEAIIFTNKLYFKYDPRVHSKYQMKNYDGDPNRIIDLGLPIAEKTRILTRYEVYSEGGDS